MHLHPQELNFLIVTAVLGRLAVNITSNLSFSPVGNRT
jgi:hypothetical protein